MGAKSEGRFSPHEVGKEDTVSHALLSRSTLFENLVRINTYTNLGCLAAGMKGLYFLIVAFKFRLVTTKLTKAVVCEKFFN